MIDLFSNDIRRDSDLLESIQDCNVQRLKNILYANQSFSAAAISLFWGETPINLNRTIPEEVRTGYPPLTYAIIHESFRNSSASQYESHLRQPPVNSAYDVVKTLLEAGAEPNFTYQDPISLGDGAGGLTSPLLESIEKYSRNRNTIDGSIVDLTIEHTNHINQPLYEHNQTAVHKTMRTISPQVHNIDAVKHVLTKLKEAGADLEQTDNLGNRPIFYCPDDIKEEINHHIQELNLPQNEVRIPMS